MLKKVDAKITAAELARLQEKYGYLKKIQMAEGWDVTEAITKRGYTYSQRMTHLDYGAGSIMEVTYTSINGLRCGYVLAAYTDDDLECGIIDQEPTCQERMYLFSRPVPPAEIIDVLVALGEERDTITRSLFAA